MSKNTTDESRKNFRLSFPNASEDNLDWAVKTKARLQRAFYRAIMAKPILKFEDDEALKERLFRICLHAEKLGWISLPGDDF